MQLLQYDYTYVKEINNNTVGTENKIVLVC